MEQKKDGSEDEEQISRDERQINRYGVWIIREHGRINWQKTGICFRLHYFTSTFEVNDHQRKNPTPIICFLGFTLVNWVSV
jgi:hypothetical protein